MSGSLPGCHCTGLKRSAANAAGLFFLSAIFFFSAGVPGLSASGYEFDGVGAAAVARGGAVIADASDWTAVYWNPANLTGVKAKEAGLELKAGKAYSRDGNSLNTPFGNPFADKKADSSFLLGSAGAVLPLNDRSAIGLGFYIPLLQGAEFSDTVQSPVIYSGIDYKGFAAIGVGNVSYARRITEALSAAAGLNVLYADLESRSTSGLAHSPFLAGAPDVVKQKMDGHGCSAEGVFGVKYRLSDKVDVGAVFRTGAKIVLKGGATATSQVLPAEKSDFKFTLRQPPTSGIGAAWRPWTGTTVTCDLTQTWWRGFSNRIDYAAAGLLIRDQANTFDWKNSYKFRLGYKRTFKKDTDLLLGYAFDTPAIDKGSIDFATAIDVPMHRLSAGVTRKWGTVRGTLSALAGEGWRRAGGVSYALFGWYFLGEAAYSF